MRRIFLLLYLVSTCFTLFAQQEEALVKLTIEVRDSASLQPLADVMCRVVNSKGKMLSYKIADRKGCLSLTAHQEDVLMFTLIGYGKRKIGVADIRQTEKRSTIILLSPKQVELKEVVVKLSPIRKQGDTLVYNVGSFLQKGDRHLEEMTSTSPPTCTHRSISAIVTSQQCSLQTFCLPILIQEARLTATMNTTTQ